MIVGVDEVGRGCWAGPLAAGAVLLRQPIAGLKDSKKLTKQQREKLDVTIRIEALAIGVGWATVEEIDQFGLTEAVRLAMARALQLITIPYKQIIIDGNYNFFADNPKSTALIVADNTVPAVSAASIVAKVARDNMMARVAKQYPAYGFDRHVGYGTALHRANLQLHGICQLHRRSFKPVQAFA